jgi:hypothetical protein
MEFEYLSDEKSQDLRGGGEHAGSGNTELVPLFRCGTGRGDEGEGVLEDILMPCKVLLMCRKHCIVKGPLPRIYKAYL